MSRELRADCSRCVGLCCVVPAFARSADFALDKPAGHPCPNLGADSAFTIHDRLRPSGFPGCVAFDCFGAGQVVAAEVLGGRDWRTSPDAAAAMMVAFPVVRALHELLWYLDAAVARPATAELHPALMAVFDDVEASTHAPADRLAELDVDAVRTRVNPLLQRAGALSSARAHRRRDASCAARTSSVPGCAASTCGGRTCGARSCSGPISAARTCAWPTSSAPTCVGQTYAEPTSPTPSSSPAPSSSRPAVMPRPSCLRRSRTPPTGRRRRARWRSPHRPGATGRATATPGDRGPR